jgi:hypothetical protein
MAGTASSESVPPVANDSGTERAIRFAVYLTGGLVTLSFGLLYITSDIGQVLNCLAQTSFCSGGFSQAIYYNTVPALVGGAIMVVIAMVLFMLARRVR